MFQLSWYAAGDNVRLREAYRENRESNILLDRYGYRYEAREGHALASGR